MLVIWRVHHMRKRPNCKPGPTVGVVSIHTPNHTFWGLFMDPRPPPATGPSVEDHPGLLGEVKTLYHLFTICRRVHHLQTCSSLEPDPSHGCELDQQLG